MYFNWVVYLNRILHTAHYTVLIAINLADFRQDITADKIFKYYKKHVN